MAVVVAAANLLPSPICHLGDRRQEYTLATIKALGEAVQEFRRSEGYYPEPRDALIELVARGYLERTPMDAWGHEYQYLAEQQTFTVRSLGADGREGGADNAADIAQTFPTLDLHDLGVAPVASTMAN